MYKLENFFKDSDYKSSIFTQDEINFIESEIFIKNDKPYIKCLIRDKDIQLKPEEAVRQLFLHRLINFYGYNPAQIKLEDAVKFGREIKRADIVIFETNHTNSQYIIVEVKKPKLKDGKEQLKSYCNATGATMGVWTNGESISYYHRKDPNYFEEIPNIPKVTEKLKDILKERKTIEDLIKIDKLNATNKSLKNLIIELEDDVLANAGVNVFEEVFKLIYTKLYDEFMSGRDKTRALEFRNYGDTDADLEKVIQNLFMQAQNKWRGVFTEKSKINLNPSHLAICISALQDVKLFNSNLEVIDDAFEYLMSKSQKGEKGQYFTPRYVIDMCVKMLNPQSHEKIIDTASGSCGFPLHAIFYVWKKILQEKGINASHLFTLEVKPPECEDFVNENIFAIDFDEEAVRVARTLNLIAGDGKTNVLHLNTLDFENWNLTTEKTSWLKKYSQGWLKFIDMRAVEDDNSKFNFDIVMANPPFAGDIKESRIISRYELGKNSKGKYQSKVGRDILFIERNINFLKPGGRMAIILPQGRFNNSSDKFIRDFIAERCRILAVVGLHGNVFKPHTGTKTSVLFIQKWDAELCPHRDDYPIFFATMTKPSKDNSGEKIFLKNPDGSFMHDHHNHLIVDHDLFNHDGLTHDGIAEAFIEFAKKENLSFFDCGSFDELKYKNLLKELECTEILFSNLNDEFRIDSEYFFKKFLIDDFQTKKFKNKFIGEFAFVTDGQHGYHELDENSNIHMLTAKNAKNFFANLDDADKIAKWVDDNNKRSSLQKNDIILSTRGTVGCCAIVFENILPANIDQDVARIKIEKNFILPEFLLVYLNSKFGQDYMQRTKTGMVQQGLSLEKVRKIPIPILSKEFQEKISELVKLAHSKLIQAQEKYSLAEKILSDELGLDKFKPSAENIAIKSFASSFGSTGRLDAEFYQPKYDDLEKIIKNFEYDSLNNLCVLINHGMQPPYVENGEVRVFSQKWINDKSIDYNFIDDVDEPRTNKEFAEKNPDYVCRKYDIVHYSVGANIGYCHTYLSDVPMMPGSFITLIRADTEKINPNYLGVVLNSVIGRTQSEKRKSGTAQPYVYPKDLKEFLIPILPIEIQEKISAQIEESFVLREESKKLLESAKKLVENEIEKI